MLHTYGLPSSAKPWVQPAVALLAQCELPPGSEQTEPTAHTTQQTNSPSSVAAVRLHMHISVAVRQHLCHTHALCDIGVTVVLLLLALLLRPCRGASMPPTQTRTGVTLMLPPCCCCCCCYCCVPVAVQQCLQCRHARQCWMRCCCGVLLLWNVASCTSLLHSHNPQVLKLPWQACQCCAAVAAAVLSLWIIASNTDTV
jgi:hypothetical protein